MAREIVVLDIQPNDTLRVGFLFPIAAVTRFTRPIDAQSTTAVLASPPPALPAGQVVPAPLPAVAYSPLNATLQPTTTAQIDPVLAAVLTNLEIQAIADGSLVWTVEIVQTDPTVDTPAKFNNKTAPAYNVIMLMYQQGLTDLLAKYQKRGRFIGVRLDAV